MYHSVTLGSSPQQFKIIFLDTRYSRSDHYFPSVGGFRFLPFAALFASVSRFVASATGLGKNYDGEVLGEMQWKWLDEELRQSTSDFNIIVSSVQVLSTNPLVESWAHFPKEKTRLLKLLYKTGLRNVLLLSGDVHHAEFSTADQTHGVCVVCDVWCVMFAEC